MDELIHLFGYKFNQRALLAGVLIGFLNGYLSAYVVIRKAALFTGALSHSLLPGIAIGIILFGFSVIGTFIGALVAALIVALGSVAIAHTTRIDRDSALAILYTSSFSAGLLLMDRLPSAMEIDGLLFGNILGLADSDLWITFGTAIVVLSFLVILQRPLHVMLFEPSIARSVGVPVRALNYLLTGLLVLTLITSLQAVGAILSLGLLVTPACILLLFVNSPRKLSWGGGVIGALCSVVAIVVSNLYNTRTGATIVLLLGIVFFTGVMAFSLKGKYKHSGSNSI